MSFRKTIQRLTGSKRATASSPQPESIAEAEAEESALANPGDLTTEEEQRLSSLPRSGSHASEGGSPESAWARNLHELELAIADAGGHVNISRSRSGSPSMDDALVLEAAAELLRRPRSESPGSPRRSRSPGSRSSQSRSPSTPAERVSLKQVMSELSPPESPKGLVHVNTEDLDAQDIFPPEWLAHAFDEVEIPPPIATPAKGFLMHADSLKHAKPAPPSAVWRTTRDDRRKDRRGWEPPRSEFVLDHAFYAGVQGANPRGGFAGSKKEFHKSRYSGGPIVWATGRDSIPASEGGNLLAEYAPEKLSCNVCHGQLNRCKNCESALRYSVWKGRQRAAVRAWEENTRPQHLVDLQVVEVDLAKRLRLAQIARQHTEEFLPEAENRAQELNEERNHVRMVKAECGVFLRASESKKEKLKDQVSKTFAENAELREMLQKVKEKTAEVEKRRIPNDLPWGEHGTDTLKQLKHTAFELKAELASRLREAGASRTALANLAYLKGEALKDLMDHTTIDTKQTKESLRADLHELEKKRLAILKFSGATSTRENLVVSTKRTTVGRKSVTSWTGSGRRSTVNSWTAAAIDGANE